MSLILGTPEDLGSITEIYSLMVILPLSHNSLSLEDLKNYCISSSCVSIHSFNGIVDLIEFLGLVDIENGHIRITEDGLHFLKAKGDKDKFRISIITRIIEKISNGESINDFFFLDGIKYDLPSGCIAILNNTIPLKYYSIRNFLIRTGFIYQSELSPNLLIINSEFNEIFEKVINTLKEKLFIGSQGRLFTYRQLQESLALREEYGQLSEDFVLDYERRRLSEHPQSFAIKQISTIDVSAGYDIASFISLGSSFIDKFIEVKSYSKNLSFYWSKNEIETARKLGDHYFLYLIDRSQYRNNDYEPRIIQNPYNSIYRSSDWSKEPIDWIITKADSN
jgi:hypothetical protein